MKLGDLATTLSLKVLSCNNNLQNNVTGGYVSDMLSDVLANSGEGNIWITLQRHINIVAVANLKNLAGILIVSNRQPEDGVLKKAAEESITIMTTHFSAFEAAGRIYQLLVDKS